jgi:mono/diheme cytochrome c family protein
MNKSVFLAAVAVSLFGARARADVKVDFKKDIEPILQQDCIKCHGPEKQKGELRLDSKAAAMKGGKDGVVITAGQADKSDLYRRVSLPAGSDDIMPSKGDPLTKAQTDLIKDWINQGATWPEGEVAKATGEGTTGGASSGPTSPLVGLVAIKPSSGEAAAITKLGAGGVDVRPVAMNMNWREANFRSQGTNATDATIAPLKDIYTLVDLNLGGTRVTDAGLQNIEALTNLVDLHLELTHVTDAGLVHLKKLSHLTYLNLYATPVTDKGLAELKGLSNLKHLYLWETKVTAQGATGLQAALPKLQISRGWEAEPAAQKAEVKKADDKKPEEKKPDSKEAKK